MVTIIIDKEKTRCLKGLRKTVPHAVVLPHTLFISGDTVRGVAQYECNASAPFEMSLEEFEQLEFREFKKAVETG